MYGKFITQGNHPQITTAKLGNVGPKSEPIWLLWFRSQRQFNDSDAHFLGELVPFSQDFIFEVRGELEFGHPESITK